MRKRKLQEVLAKRPRCSMSSIKSDHDTRIMSEMPTNARLNVFLFLKSGYFLEFYVNDPSAIFNAEIKL